MPVPEDVYIAPPLGTAGGNAGAGNLGSAGGSVGAIQWGNGLGNAGASVSGGGQAGGAAGAPLGTAGVNLGTPRGTPPPTVGFGQPVDVSGSPNIPQIVGEALGRGLSSFLNSWLRPSLGFNPFGSGVLGLRPGETEDEMRRRKAEEMAGGMVPIGVRPATHITPETTGRTGAAQPTRTNPLTGQPFTQTPGGATDVMARYQQARANLEQLKGRPVTAAEDAALLNLANQSRPGQPIGTQPAGTQPAGAPGAGWGDVNTISRALANWRITQEQAYEMAKANLPPGMSIDTFWKSILDRVSQERGGGAGRGAGGAGGAGGGAGAPVVTPPMTPGGEPNIMPIQPDMTGRFVIPDWYFANMPQASIDAVVAWLRNHGYQPITMGRFAPSEWAGAPGQIFADVNSLPDDPYVRWIFYRMGWTSASPYPEVTA